MRQLASLLCVALLLVYSGGSALAQPKAQDSARNLLAAMKLWGDIKFFDPEIAAGKIDWDAAFTNAEPAILSATTSEAERAGIASMLGPLHDPATHVDDLPSPASKRISAAKVGNAVFITVPHGVNSDDAQVTTDVASALALAAKSAVVAIDLRGVSEASTGDAAALRYMFSAESPIVALVRGSFTLPRERSRSYLGYPNQSSGYQGYSAFDSITDGLTVEGTSKVQRHFAILVDTTTSLPSMAVALADAGDATIYTIGGSPTILAPSAIEMEMPDGIHVSYRVADLPDIGQPLVLPTANSPEEAIARLAPSQDLGRNRPRPDTASPSENAYRDSRFPPEPLRLLAIARIYNVIRYFSPYTGLMHDDWDTAAVQAIRDETSATDTRSYVLGLMKFYAHLHDSHGFVTGDAVTAEFGAGVPFKTRYLRGQAVVTRMALGFARSGALQAGDVIDAVNGVPIRRAMTDIERYLSASTPQAADSAALRPSLQPSVFTGKKGTSVDITFHDLHGKRHTLALNRNVFSFAPDRLGPKYLVLPGNVGYVDFDRIDPSEVDAMFEALRNTRAIVFDNRGYPRGAAWAIAPRLTMATGVRAALFDTPFVTDPLDVTSDDIRVLPHYRDFYQLLPTADGWKYLKPTVMLIDERAISQSEHSVLFFRAAAHTRFVGTPTNGADGDVTSLVVPGGISFNFSGEGVRYANGDQLQRVGIIPDVRAEPTAANVAAADDVVLQKGLDEALRLAGSTAQFRNTAIRNEVARERRAATTPASSQAFAGNGQNVEALKLPWKASGSAYVGTIAAGAGYLGSDELTLASSGSGTAGASFGSFSAALDIGSYRGKTVRIRGYLSAQDVTGGVGFWLRIDGPLQQFDNMQDRWMTGTSGWKPFAIILHVPASATQAYSGLLLEGAGTAHASGLTIDVVPDGTLTTGN